MFSDIVGITLMYYKTACLYDYRSKIQNTCEAIVDMMKWSWGNHWMEQTTSETSCTELLKTRLPHLYNKVQPIAHEIFCTDYPNSEHMQGFGVYKIFCPDEIVEFAAYSSKDYYLKQYIQAFIRVDDNNNHYP